MKLIKDKNEWNELKKLFGKFETAIDPRTYPCFAQLASVQSNGSDEYLRFLFIYGEELDKLQKRLKDDDLVSSVK